MMNLREFFDNILNNEGFEAYENMTDELIALVEQEDSAWINGEELDLVNIWALDHNIDLSAICMVNNHPVTYYQLWCWDNFDD